MKILKQAKKIRESNCSLFLYKKLGGEPMSKPKREDVKEKLVLVEGWARDGLTDEEIAKNLGIGKTAIYKYKKEHAKFANTLKRGKEVIDYEVENALLKRALGYEYTEVKVYLRYLRVI